MQQGLNCIFFFRRIAKLRDLEHEDLEEDITNIERECVSTLYIVTGDGFKGITNIERECVSTLYLVTGDGL